MKMTRIDFIKAAAIVASAAYSANVCVRGGTPSTRPNIVTLFADDQGYGDVGCFGGAHVETPQIDKMAEEGMELTRSYAPPVCSPSRAAIMQTAVKASTRYPVGRKYTGQPIWRKQ